MLFYVLDVSIKYCELLTISKSLLVMSNVTPSGLEMLALVSSSVDLTTLGKHRKFEGI